MHGFATSTAEQVRELGKMAAVTEATPEPKATRGAGSTARKR
jgi:hypothetical protein